MGHRWKQTGNTARLNTSSTLDRNASTKDEGSSEICKWWMKKHRIVLLMGWMYFLMFCLPPSSFSFISTPTDTHNISASSFSNQRVSRGLMRRTLRTSCENNMTSLFFVCFILFLSTWEPEQISVLLKKDAAAFSRSRLVLNMLTISVWENTRLPWPLGTGVRLLCVCVCVYLWKEDPQQQSCHNLVVIG